MKINLSKVIGHRGASGTTPENTLLAIKEASRLGAKCVELDVKLTYDNELILFHDETLDRTTNGSGKVEEKLLNEIKELDAGSWFSKSFAGEKIPTFDEAIELCFELNLYLNIEIKPCPGRANETGTLVGRKIREWRANRGMIPLVTSFSNASLDSMLNECPFAHIGKIYSSIKKEDMTKYKSKTFDAVVLSASCVTRDIVFEAKKNRLKIIVYTVNDFSLAKKFFNWGVSSIITDFPGNLVGI